ncbi:MAG: methylmalonyl-CoA mutase [Nitrososphaeria archaeon]|nr:methylmalonyl-CoA mutase [Nitrososphaeria archaeon]
MSVEEKEKEWEERIVKRSIERFPERDEIKTLSGIPIKRVYTASDLPGFDYLDKLGFPGQYPFVRGVYPTMYRGRFWTMRQYAGFGTAEDTNKRYKFLLEQGQTGLSMAFDLPTQIGYDSDHPLAHGEVGKVGVAIPTLKDLEVVFDGISLERVSTSMTINATAPILLAMYLVLGGRQGAETTGLRGTVQNDVLKEYVARGTYIFPPEASLKLATDIFEYCAENAPRWNTISISGYHIREAGATAVQELAFTLANGIAYAQSAVDIGLDIDYFAPRLSFFFAVHNDFFEEIAKFRAARRLWAKIMKERFGAKRPQSLMLRFHTQTSGVTLTAQQPDNNVVRVTLQALAAVLGGTQSLHTNSLDEALSLPSETTVRTALRTQQIIANESNVTETIDPVGGSYYVEWLTDEIERGVIKYIEQIDEMGGMVSAIERGYIQREISDSSYRYQRDVENKNKVIVGVNDYEIEEDLSIELFKLRPEVEDRQLVRLKEVRRMRNNEKVRDYLNKIRGGAEKGENIMPLLLRGINAYATLGEICDVLREVYREYRAPEAY